MAVGTMGVLVYGTGKEFFHGLLMGGSSTNRAVSWFLHDTDLVMEG